MIRLNDYLDKLSIIKVLSFFILIILVLTLIPMIFNFNLGNLTFKSILYGSMLLFFIYRNCKHSIRQCSLLCFEIFKQFIHHIIQCPSFWRFHFIRCWCFASLFVGSGYIVSNNRRDPV